MLEDLLAPSRSSPLVFFLVAPMCSPFPSLSGPPYSSHSALALALNCRLQPKDARAHIELELGLLPFRIGSWSTTLATRSVKSEAEFVRLEAMTQQGDRKEGSVAWKGEEEEGCTSYLNFWVGQGEGFTK